MMDFYMDRIFGFQIWLQFAPTNLTTGGDNESLAQVQNGSAHRHNRSNRRGLNESSEMGVEEMFRLPNLHTFHHNLHK